MIVASEDGCGSVVHVDVEKVVPGAAVEMVSPAPGKERVIARAAKSDVVPAVDKNRIVAGPTGDVIVTTVAVELETDRVEARIEGVVATRPLE
ncbi:MAG: hypothetical protein AAGA32_00445, partial [Pseudomonadota bacterium]